MPEPSAKDLEHLRLLTICHYVNAVLTALAGCYGIVHFAMGLWFEQRQPEFQAAGGPPWFYDVYFYWVGVFILLFGWAFGLVIAHVGRCIAERRGRKLAMVVSGIQCLNPPLGTLLGIFTMLVLCRPAVRELFEAA